MILKTNVTQMIETMSTTVLLKEVYADRTRLTIIQTKGMRETNLDG